MDLHYKILHSRRKKITITVERDRSVVVRVPEGTSAEEIRYTVESKKIWLYEKLNHPQKYRDQSPRKEFVSGESVLYLGRNYQLELRKDGQESIRLVGRFIVTSAELQRARELFKTWYRSRAKEIISPRVSHYARNLGVAYKKVLISDLQYRWGSCTPNNNLSFNWRLIKAPMNVVNYVIVHELAHLLESNHTPRFWNIVKAQVPHYATAKNWLKEHGEVLETDF